MDSDKRLRLVSLVGAFCHLLKKTGQLPSDLRVVLNILKGFLLNYMAFSLLCVWKCIAESKL